MMAWVKSHQELRNHPKTKKAARLLNIGEPQLVGHLHFLWWWALEHAQDGDLTDYDREEIDDAAGWTGEGDLVTALCECGKAGGAGFLERTADGRLLIHDWMDYAGRLMTQREQGAARVRAFRERNALHTRYERVSNDVRVEKSRVEKSREEQPLIQRGGVKENTGAAPTPPEKTTAQPGNVRKAEPSPEPHPSVQAYCELTGLQPAPVLRARIESEVRDVEQWRKVVTSWLAAGFKAGNLNGMLEWNRDGIPAFQPPKRNGAKKPAMPDGASYVPAGYEHLIQS